MKKPAAIILLLIVLLGGGAFALTNMSKDEAPHQNGDTSSHADNKSDMNSQASSEPAKPNEVQIKDFAFAPETITVKKGTKVTWTNQDSAKHDISPTGGGDDFKESELLAKGESYSFTFNTVGTYTYKCSPHPYMKGTVVVTE